MLAVKLILLRICMKPKVLLVNLGLTNFSQCLEIQQQIVASKLNFPKRDIVLFLQHHDVFTGGRRIKEQLSIGNFPFIRCNRGGQVTFHNPGQLVVYPILNLKNYKLSVKWYVERIQSVVVETLRDIGIDNLSCREGVGVWTADGKKIASIGIQIKQWITMHGFSINVVNDLEPFNSTDICGQQKALMAKVENLVPTVKDVDMLLPSFKNAFENIFEVELIKSDKESFLQYFSD